ncbi:hypothetical protein [Streptomyces sp. CRN 30]|uniref:hypothetical protein n=1 Tax=Streptomyces sp. CRN 30 TaxID=3075613 RepID=UPI002A7EEC30|nr:hypothetical protein [Streptomyces sp. CRN 30]
MWPTEYLAEAETFDATYAIGTLAFIDPHRALLALRDDSPLPTRIWVLAPQLWEYLLTEYGEDTGTPSTATQQ